MQCAKNTRECPIEKIYAGYVGSEQKPYSRAKAILRRSRGWLLGELSQEIVQLLQELLSTVFTRGELQGAIRQELRSSARRNKTGKLHWVYRGILSKLDAHQVAFALDIRYACLHCSET